MLNISMAEGPTRTQFGGLRHRRKMCAFDAMSILVGKHQTSRGHVFA